MKIVIFGLSISSSWGNGHATLWRGLCRALGDRGHAVTFFERDVPYYAATRDGTDFAGCRLKMYDDWNAIAAQALSEVKEADAAIVTSYCPDAAPASGMILDHGPRLRVFYDLDTPVTLSRLDEGKPVEYLPPQGLGAFDLVLSYTGGRALTDLQQRLGARRVAPLYGSVDPQVHRPADKRHEFAGDLSYLGTYAEDRQQTLTQLFVEPARQRPQLRFVMGGAQYPHEFPWTGNIYFVRHLPPSLHPAFYGSSRLTLNVTRRAMAGMGYCPSARLFEAAACRVPVATDVWEGIEHFYEPDRELILCRRTEDVLDALGRAHQDLQLVAARARERTLNQHTAMHRARELEQIFEQV